MNDRDAQEVQRLRQQLAQVIRERDRLRHEVHSCPYHHTHAVYVETDAGTDLLWGQS